MNSLAKKRLKSLTSSKENQEQGYMNLPKDILEKLDRDELARLLGCCEKEVDLIAITTDFKLVPKRIDEICQVEDSWLRMSGAEGAFPHYEGILEYLIPETAGKLLAAIYVSSISSSAWIDGVRGSEIWEALVELPSNFVDVA